MRLFLSIPLNKELSNELYKVQHAIKSNLGFSDKLLLVHPQKMHITIKFFEDFPKDKFNDMIEALKSIDIPKFSIDPDKINYFTKPNGSPRVVFLSFKKSKELTAFHELIESKLAPLGVKKDALKCHITLFRVKFLKDKYRLIEILKHVKVSPIPLEINSMELYESTLTDDVPVHELLEKFELK